MQDKILRKIKRCLALARSNNPNEAATALRQAQALMAKYGVTHEDVAISDVESSIAQACSGKTPPTYIAMLANMVAGAFGVEVIYSSHCLFDTWKGSVEFYGIGSTAEIAAYAYEVLARQLKLDRTAYQATLSKRLKRATKIRRGDLYAQGWVESVSRHVVPCTRSEHEDQAIDAYKAKRWPKPLKSCEARNNTRKTRHHDHGAYYSGCADGKKVDFHQGVNGTRQAAIEGR